MYKSLSDKEIKKEFQKKMNCESRKARTNEEKQLSQRRIDQLKLIYKSGKNYIYLLVEDIR